MQDETPGPLYLPFGQSMHVVASGDECVPAPQFEQVASPRLLIFPSSQEKQDCWPVAAWYLPFPHSEHAMFPVPLAFFPAAHARHAVAAGSALYLPLSHSEHRGWPTDAWYLPAVHFAQFLCSSCSCIVPAGHGVQEPAPVLFAYRPASQDTHASVKAAGA